MEYRINRHWIFILWIASRIKKYTLEITLLWLFFIFIPRVYSQGFRHAKITNVSEQAGLPSSETYKVVEDQLGYIWIATDNGIFKYDGKEHQIFDKSDGLSTSAVYHLFLQEDTSIVAVCASSHLIKIKNNSIEYLIHKDTMSKYMSNYALPFSYYKDQDNRHHIGTRWGYFCFDEESRLVVEDTLKYNGHQVQFWPIKDSSAFCYWRLANFYPNELVIEREGQVLDIFPSASVVRSIYMGSNTEYDVIPIGKDIFIYSKKENRITRYDVPVDVLSVCFVGNDLLLNTREHGTLFYSYEGNNLRFEYQILDGLSVSSVLLSSSGSLWATTLEDGVKVVSPKGAACIYESQELITRFLKNDTLFIVGSDLGKIDLGDTSIQLTPHTHLISDIKVDNDRILISNGYCQIMLFDQNGEISVSKEIKSGRDKIKYVYSSFYKKLNDSIAFVKGSNFLHFLKWEGQNKVHVVDSLELAHRITNYFSLSENSFFVTTEEELIFMRFLGGKISIQSRLPMDVEIIYYFERNEKLLGITKDHQIAEIREDTIVLFPLPSIAGVNNVLQAKYFREVLHIATNLGMFSWKFKEAGQTFKLINFEAIPLIRQIEIFNDSLFLSTNRSIYRKSINDLAPFYPKLYLQSVVISDENYPIQEQYELNYFENDIELMLSGIAFEEPVLNYRIQLKGRDNKSFISESPFVHYSDLKSGIYTFEASASCDGINYSEPLSIQFSILKPLWETWWFYSLIGAVIISIILLLWMIRLKRIRRKIEMKSTIDRLRSQALAAQLNPHLIFNVLNGIQGKVSEGEIEEANIYISRFAKFLRNSLDKMKVSTIPIQEELEMIRLYITLEESRFEDKIQFEIRGSIESDKVMVPPLVLQPIVENAIQHGILPDKNEIGDITLHIEENKKEIMITISDFGIGFPEGAVFGDGLRISRDRLKSLSLENEITVIHYKKPTSVQVRIVK